MGPFRRRPAPYLRVSAAAILVLIFTAPTVVGTGSGLFAAAPSPVPAQASHHSPVHAPVLIPHRAIRAAHPAGSKLIVNPYQYYSSEPAPMGIADFGIDSHGNPYGYRTSAIYGDTAIRSLTVSLGGSTALTIQLNVVLNFSIGGSYYEYWIQDVAFLDTSGNQVSFENNIWNFSSSGAGLDTNSVTGNGTIYGGQVYIASADASLPGNGISLTYPTHIGLLAVVKVSSGEPEVLFEYRDGHGLVTYDNALFPFARGATGINFTVNGTNYNGIGLYDDSELILGGPGGGASTAATAGNLSMSLSYSNGHNFQSVQNAYNFGSDTAEAISGLTSQRGIIPVNGSLMDNLTHGVDSTPASLFNDSYAGSVNIVTQLASGTLKINGTTGIPFTSFPINVSLAPANYSFALYQGVTLIGSTTATLTPGGSLLLFIDAGTVSTVQFVETGLPTGHSWAVSYGPYVASTKTTTLQFLTINGSFTFRVHQISGWVPNVTHGLLQIAGASQVVLLNFTELFYAVQIFETGLPDNTTWSVFVNNETFASNQVFLTFPLPNGTFPYSLGLVPGWTGAPNGRGSLVVSGLSIRKTFTFHQFTYEIAIIASGLPLNSPWGIEVNGSWSNGSINTLLSAQPNGTYPYRVVAPGGWIADTPSGTVTVFARPVFINVSFTPYLYPLTFTEQGLATGTLWGLALGSTHLTSTSTNLVVRLGNGSYPYVVDDLLGYVLQGPANGTAFIEGQPAGVTLVFAPPPVIVGWLLGSVTPTRAILLVNGSEVSFSGGTFNITLNPGPYSLEFYLSGYYPIFKNVSIVAGHRTVLLPVVLHAIPPGGGGSIRTDNGTSGTFLGLSTLEVGVIAIGALLAVLGVALVTLRRRRP